MIRMFLSEEQLGDYKVGDVLNFEFAGRVCLVRVIEIDTMGDYYIATLEPITTSGGYLH